jgi:hypothetical protein
MDPELVEVGIRPSESDLEDMVQVGDGTVTGDEQTSPDHRADAQQKHFELVNGEVCGRGVRGSSLATPLISHTFSQSLTNPSIVASVLTEPGIVLLPLILVMVSARIS